MPWGDSVRTVLAALFLLAVAVPRYLARVRQERATVAAAPGADVASRAQRSFDALKPFVPVSGRIGYLEPRDWPSQDAVLWFYLAEYVLTPRIVIFGTNAEWVIAVPQTGTRPDSTEEDPRLKGFVLSHRFDDGVLLFRRVN
jgi:hypothetical protein